MKFKHALLIFSMMFFSIEVQAYTTMDELTSPESLINYNYSSVTADHVQLTKAQNANREYKSGKYAKKSWWRKAWEYIDFATDDGCLLQKDIEPSHSWKDW